MELGESAVKGAERDTLEEAQADVLGVTHPDIPLIGQGKRRKEKKQVVGTGSGFEVQGQRKEKKRKSTHSQTVEEVGTAGGVEEQGKKKKKKNRGFAPSETVEEVGADSGFEAQGQRKKKEKKRKSTHSQTVEEVGSAGGVEEQGKKKRKKNPDFAPSEIVEEVGADSGFEAQGQRKKKEKKRKSTHSQTVEEVGSAGGVEEQKKKKKKKKKKKNRDFAPAEIVEEVGIGSGFEVQGQRKKKVKKSKPILLQTVEEVGTADGVEEQSKKKKKKKKNRDFAPADIVEEVGIGSGFEVQGQRKKKERKGKPTPSLTVAEVGTGPAHEVPRKRKKEKTRNPTPSQTVDEVGTGNFLELHGKKSKKSKEKSSKESTPSVTVEDFGEAEIGSGGESGRKRRKKDKNLTTSETLEDCGPGRRTAKNTVLATPEPQTGIGAESVKKKKKVTFQLPDSTQDDPSENELLEEQFETMHTNSWATDKLRPGFVWGVYTPQEDGALKQAIFDYIQEQGWDREDGLRKILNSKNNEARGCWYTIRKCLPQRELKRIYTRAHRLFDPGNYLGKWTPEETQSLIELHRVHGNKWKKISTIIGRDALNCKDRWRYINNSGSHGRKSGLWSEEEHQKLCALVLKCLHVRRQMAKKGQLRKHHKVVRDEINWEFIAEHMDGRNRLDCMSQWYRRMASPMVTTGDWSNGDDQHLLERLMEEFPLSEELVEWDSLLEHRSGELCKRRWEQMQRPLGRGPALRHLHFLEKLEGVVMRFAPHLADADYDPQFAAKLEQADADASQEGEDT